jgi:hypothetical protein
VEMVVNTDSSGRCADCTARSVRAGSCVAGSVRACCCMAVGIYRFESSEGGSWERR